MSHSSGEIDYTVGCNPVHYDALMLTAHLWNACLLSSVAKPVWLCVGLSSIAGRQKSLQMSITFIS